MKHIFEVDSVTLNVYNLDQLKEYYQKVIGLTLLKETDKEVVLGNKKNKPLLTLVKVDQNQRKKNAGLYHLAILLDSREALGTFLKHLIKHQYSIDGASDHGYSEAIYMHDPEGNGIEIYRDKDSSEWDVRDDGSIEGITIAMDAQGVLNAGKDQFDGLNENTKMGHVHLHVNNLVETQHFYVDILKLQLKSDYGNQAKFFASGFYHHHVGANTWAGTNLSQPDENDLGLSYFTLTYKGDINELNDDLKHHDIQTKKDDEVLILKDNSGIGLHIKAVS